MGVKGASGPLGMLIRIDMQHDARHLAPVGTFCIGIQHPYVHDGVLVIVRGEHRLGRGNVGSIRV